MSPYPHVYNSFVEVSAKLWLPPHAIETIDFFSADGPSLNPGNSTSKGSSENAPNDYIQNQQFKI